MNWKIILACGLACLLPAVVLADTGTLTRAARILDAPFADAASRAELAQGTVVEVVTREGGWYLVRTSDGNEGWLRLSSLRLGEGAREKGASLFTSTGRAGARNASATTGIRGLSETEIRDAHADAAAVKRLDDFAAEDAETQRFAAEIGLAKRDVSALPKDVEKGGKR
ncbi:MAG TPA: SH3 domain-containing protein [Gammaproteobacteria bacterium]|nr:SH3 domain-containing protein [Gammaproteobacteria bacterium]